MEARGIFLSHPVAFSFVLTIQGDMGLEMGKVGGGEGYIKSKLQMMMPSRVASLVFKVMIRIA